MTAHCRYTGGSEALAGPCSIPRTIADIATDNLTGSFSLLQAMDHRFTVWANRLPLRILNELTTTITTFVVLFPPAGRAVLHDVITTTAWAE
jgi:hypothetical protein